MARARTARHPKPESVEPEEESQELPDENEQETPVGAPQAAPKAAPPPAARESISKAEAVRRALAEGLDDLDDIEDFLKKQYGIEMPRPQISAYKAQAKAKERKTDGGEAPPRRRTAAAPTQSPPPRSDGSIIDDIEAVRRLIDKHGKDGLKRLVDALG